MHSERAARACERPASAGAGRVDPNPVALERRRASWWLAGIGPAALVCALVVLGAPALGQPAHSVPLPTPKPERGESAPSTTDAIAPAASASDATVVTAPEAGSPAATGIIPSAPASVPITSGATPQAPETPTSPDVAPAAATESFGVKIEVAPPPGRSGPAMSVRALLQMSDSELLDRLRTGADLSRDARLVVAGVLATTDANIVCLTRAGIRAAIDPVIRGFEEQGRLSGKAWPIGSEAGTYIWERCGRL